MNEYINTALLISILKVHCEWLKHPVLCPNWPHIDGKMNQFP